MGRCGPSVMIENPSLRRRPATPGGITVSVVLTCLMAASCGLIFGYDVDVSASCDQWPEHLHSVHVQRHQHSVHIPYHHLEANPLQLLQKDSSTCNWARWPSAPHGRSSLCSVTAEETRRPSEAAIPTNRDRRSDSPIPKGTPLMRSGSLSKKASLLKTSSVRVQTTSQPKKLAPLRSQADRSNDSKDGEHTPKKSRKFLKSILSRRKSKIDEPLPCYFDDY